jgi:hypothetical protein
MGKKVGSNFIAPEAADTEHHLIGWCNFGIVAAFLFEWVNMNATRFGNGEYYVSNALLSFM